MEIIKQTLQSLARFAFSAILLKIPVFRDIMPSGCVCFSTFVRPRPGKFFFHKTRARPQRIYSSVPFQFFLSSYIKLTHVLIINYGIIIKSISTLMCTVWHVDKYRLSQEECARLREGVPYVKVYRYNPKHLCPKLNGYGDNGQISMKFDSCYTLIDYQIHIKTGRNMWFL